MSDSPQYVGTSRRRGWLCPCFTCVADVHVRRASWGGYSQEPIDDTKKAKCAAAYFTFVNLLERLDDDGSLSDHDKPLSDLRRECAFEMEFIVPISVHDELPKMHVFANYDLDKVFFILAFNNGDETRVTHIMGYITAMTIDALMEMCEESDDYGVYLMVTQRMHHRVAEILAEIETVTIADLQQTCRKQLLPAVDQLALSVVGPEASECYSQETLENLLGEFALCAA